MVIKFWTERSQISSSEYVERRFAMDELTPFILFFFSAHQTPDCRFAMYELLLTTRVLSNVYFSHIMCFNITPKRIRDYDPFRFFPFGVRSHMLDVSCPWTGLGTVLKSRFVFAGETRLEYRLLQAIFQ